MQVRLNVKTEYTLLSSLIKIPKLVSFACHNNLKELAILDDNLSYVIEFYNLCTKNNIKPIIGLEVIVDQYPIALYAKNYEGYKNLLYLNYLKTKQNITINDLLDYSDNIICIVPYFSNNMYSELQKIFKYIYEGYENNEQKQKLGINSVFFKPVFYLEKEEANYLKYLLLIKGEETSYLDNDYTALQDKNINTITSMINVKLEFANNLLPKYSENAVESKKYLRKLCKEGLVQKFGKSIQRAYLDRLEYELSIIDKMGYNDYFLIVWDYVKYAKEQGILVGPGRGSSASSLVAYLLSITAVDPLKYGLLFERFLNPERISMPDIDIDFPDNKRDVVLDYLKNKYGTLYSGEIITYGTYASKAVIRDLGRILKINVNKIDLLSNNLDARLSLKENLKNNKVKSILEIHDDLKKIYQIAFKLEGLKKHRSSHPAGIVLSNKKLYEVVPFIKEDDNYLVSITYDYLEQNGLLKMDLLAIKNLTIIAEILKDINISFEDIPLHDENTFKMFSAGKTNGIFQFESKGMKEYLMKLKPNTFSDITALIALYRPGPMQYIDLFIKRKLGYLDDYLQDVLLLPITKETYGIMVYQEQIMQVLNKYANYSLAEADIFRKAISKKQEDILINMREDFLKRANNLGRDYNKSLKLYEDILKFSAYGFNKAHSVVYSIISYKMMYLKANYPYPFYTNLLTNQIGSINKTNEYIYELLDRGIKMNYPDINISTTKYIYNKSGIYYPLSNIKGVGKNISLIIEKEREKGLFKDVYDFIKRLNKNINGKIFKSLIQAGCFDSFNLQRKTLIDNIDILINYGDLAGFSNIEKPLLNNKTEYSDKQLRDLEYEVLGLYLSNHPAYEKRLKYPKAIKIENIPNYFNKEIFTVGLLKRIQEIKTKNNDTMAFLEIQDETGEFSLTVFPKTLENLKLSENDIYLINGKVEKRFANYQLIVYKMEKL